MAKDEVDENEPTEDEEEVEEERPRKKKLTGGRGSRPRGRPLKRAGSLGDPRLYHRDVPVGPEGVALEDVPMDVERIERIGGFDEESVRITENMKRYLSGKARGEADIRFNGRSREKYFAIRKIHHGAIVAIKQVHPVLNEALPPTNMSACPTYDSLLQFVRERYWKGEDAIYEWQAYTENKASLGIGRFQFAADPDWDREIPHQPQHHQPPQQASFNQFGMPGMMMPPQMPGMAPMFFPTPQAQPQQTHQQNPAIPGDPMALIAPLLQYILQMNGSQAAQAAYLQTLPQVIEQKVREAAPPPAPPPPAPPPPPTPVEQMEQAANIIATVNRTGKQIAGALGFQQNPNQVHEPPPADGDDDFPIQVRRVGPLNIAAQDGKIVDNALVQAGVNAGPVLGLIDGFFKRLSDSKKETAEIELKTLEAKKEWERQRLENLERAAALQQQMQSPPARGREPESEPWTPPAWSVERKPAEPEPTS